MTPIGPSPGMAGHQQRWMLDANLWRAADTPDGMGGVTRDWALVGTVKVAAALARPVEGQRADQEGVEHTHDLKLPLGTDVLRGDRLILSDGTEVEVITVTTAPLESVIHVQARQEPWDGPTV